MCQGISKIGGAGPAAGPQETGANREMSRVNPSGRELMDLMSETRVGEIISSTNTRGSAYVDLTPNDQGWLIVRMLGEGETQPGESITLQDAQTVFENTGIVLDGDTKYVLTNAFSGCSFFLLDIGGQEHVFHINEKPHDATLGEKLKPFAVVAERIMAGKQPEEGRDAYFTRLIDGFMEQHPTEEITALKSSDPDAYRARGLALMVMGNLGRLSGYAFTETTYNRGRTFDESGALDEPYACNGTAMLVKEEGHWSMIEQSQQVIDKGMISTDPQVVRGGHHPLFPPDVFAELERIAGLEARPIPGIMV